MPAPTTPTLRSLTDPFSRDLRGRRGSFPAHGTGSPAGEFRDDDPASTQEVLQLRNHVPQRRKSLEGGSPLGEGFCQNPWARAVVQPDGAMVVCQGFHDYELGNVRDQPFDALWNGEAMRRFRASLTEDGLFPYCSRCCELYELDES